MILYDGFYGEEGGEAKGQVRGRIPLMRVFDNDIHILKPLLSN